MASPHTPPSPSLRQPLVQEDERRRNSGSLPDARSFQSEEEDDEEAEDGQAFYRPSNSEDGDVSSFLMAPARNTEEEEDPRGFSSPFSLPKSAVRTSPQTSRHPGHGHHLPLHPSAQQPSTSAGRSLSSCPYMHSSHSLARTGFNSSSSPPPPPPPGCASSSSPPPCSPSRAYDARFAGVCPAGNTEESGSLQKATEAISPLAGLSSRECGLYHTPGSPEVLQVGGGPLKKEEKSSSKKFSSSTPDSCSRAVGPQGRLSSRSTRRFPGRFLKSLSSASPSLFPACCSSSSPSPSSSSSSSSPIQLSSPSRLLAPVSAAAPSSSTVLYQAYEVQKLERKRYVTYALLCAGFDLLLLLPLLTPLVQTQRSTPFYSLSHSLIDVAVLHLCRASVIFYALFRLIEGGGGPGRWLRKSRARTLSVLIEEEEEILAATCREEDFLSDGEKEDEGKGCGPFRSEDNEHQRAEGAGGGGEGGGTSLGRLLISRKREEKKERRRKTREDASSLKWGSEHEGLRTIMRRTDSENSGTEEEGRSPGKAGEEQTDDVAVCINQTREERSDQRFGGTRGPCSSSSSSLCPRLPSSQSLPSRRAVGEVEEMTPSSSSSLSSPFSSSTSSSSSISSFSPLPEDLHAGHTKSSPARGGLCLDDDEDEDGEAQQAHRVLGLAICLAEEEERQSGRRVETAKTRISTAARILGVAFLCAILKAINFRFENLLHLDTPLTQSLGLGFPLVFSSSPSSASSSSALSLSLSSFDRSDERRGLRDVSVYVELLLLLLPLLEVVWAVLAPPLEAFFLWRVRQHLIEERSLLHRRFLQLQQTQRSLQHEAELRRRRRKRALKREAAGEAGGFPGSALTSDEEDEGDKAEEEATSRRSWGPPGTASSPSAEGGSREDTLNEEEEEETFETVEFLKLLRPYFWPTGRSFSSSSSSSPSSSGHQPQEPPPSLLESPFVLRLLAVSTFFCVGVSKGLTLVSPLLLGAAAAAAARAAALFAAVPGHQHGQLQPGDGGGGGLGEQQGEQGVGGGRGGGHGGEGGVLEANDDALAEARIAAQFVVGFACAAFGSKLFKEAQMLAYQKVQQAAYVEVSGRTLSHLLSLPLEWHVKKQIGYVLRATDRGTEACSSLMTYLVLYLLPAIFECTAVCLVFIFHMRHRVLASLLFLSLSLYGWLTLKVTLWRRKWREAQNRSDSTYHQLAIDALTNFETVKMYNAESYEVDRYMKAVQDYQSLGTRIQASLSFLNSAQQAIVYATLVGGLCFTVQSISEGSMGVGDFVTVQMYLLNVFAPLNFLGTIYNVIVRSLADAQNLSHLLGTKPRIVDAPGALSLVDLLTRPAPPSSYSTSTAPASAPVTSGYTTPPGGVNKPQFSPRSLQHPTTTRGEEGDKHPHRGDVPPPSYFPPLLLSALHASKEQEDAKLRSPSPSTEEELIECHRLQAPIKPLTVWPVGGPLPPPKLPYAPGIEFDNVYFSYYGDGFTRAKGSIRGVSLKIAPCTTCAFVGVSGSGKSTLTKLLMRLLEPDRGRILINGVDIALVTQASLRACIGMVPQDPVMFNATIYENIAYARPDASFEEVEAAAEAAQILPSIRAMKEGWSTPVGERGLRLSGGERQRVAIARCLLRNPPIVMLDEATSSLDSVTEANIQRALLQLNNNRTALVVAHRLSTIRHADVICVMRAGRIVERGTHAELLAKKKGGVYAQLWRAQEAKLDEDQTEGSGEVGGDEPTRREEHRVRRAEKNEPEPGRSEQPPTQAADTSHSSVERQSARGRCPFLHG